VVMMMMNMCGGAGLLRRSSAGGPGGSPDVLPDRGQGFRRFHGRGPRQGGSVRSAGVLYAGRDPARAAGHPALRSRRLHRVPDRHAHRRPLRRPLLPGRGRGRPGGAQQSVRGHAARHHPRQPRAHSPAPPPSTASRSITPGAASTWPPTAPARSGASNSTATSSPRTWRQMPQRRRYRAQPPTASARQSLCRHLPRRHHRVRRRSTRAHRAVHEASRVSCTPRLCA
jgi:hypothetical protein